MKTNYMPALWTLHHNDTGHATSVRSDGKNVCVFRINDFDTLNATAQLIAASPKLAERLTDLIQYLGKDWDGDSMVEECKEALAEAGCSFEYDEEI